MFYCRKHAEERGWPYPEDTSSPFTFPPTSFGLCELCPRDAGAQVCADVPSSALPDRPRKGDAAMPEPEHHDISEEQAREMVLRAVRENPATLVLSIDREGHMTLGIVGDPREEFPDEAEVMDAVAQIASALVQVMLDREPGDTWKSHG